MKSSNASLRRWRRKRSLLSATDASSRRWMIDLPPLGNINLHGSLLPKYRGAAPIQWAIAMGETTTGVTTMRIDAGLDTGDILQQAEERIVPDDTAIDSVASARPDGC